MHTMKRLFPALLALGCSAALALAQLPLGGLGAAPTPDPRFDANFALLLGAHQAFSADMEYAVLDAEKKPVNVVPGKLAYLESKSRFEIDMSQVRGLGAVSEMAAQLKIMGLADLVMIRRPDKSLKYLVYPGLGSYVEEKLTDKPADPAAKTRSKKETTEIGQETLEGHPCVKTRVVVTDDTGHRLEATLWNATDLKQFPLRIEMLEDGKTTTRLFKNVRLAKPDAALFEPPASLARYESIGAMMQGFLMKSMGVGK